MVADLAVAVIVTCQCISPVLNPRRQRHGKKGGKSGRLQGSVSEPRGGGGGALDKQPIFKLGLPFSNWLLL